MTEYRAYIVGRDGHFSGFEGWFAATTRKPSRALSAWLTATTWSFGAALVLWPAWTWTAQRAPPHMK